MPTKKEKKIVTTTETGTEGYVVYDNDSGYYCNECLEAVDELRNAYIFETQEDVIEAIDEYASEPEYFDIHQIKFTTEILKTFKRKVTYEEIVEE